ncbi:MAG: thioredoxin domain-containing protein [Phycisphaerales bacterium]
MPNHLADQTSPYLLQHASNPVDWYPWGEQAWKAARSRDVPIFLSVGYSTCYWCHVMERESFEDPRLADRLNRGFVSIKVDREERPDVDEVYMLATQLMTGHGGWPMSVFLEPQTLRPFWCGTYLPPEPRRGLPSFTQVLEAISDAWEHRRAEVHAQAERLADAVREQLEARHQPVPVGQPQVRAAIDRLMQMFDRSNGGFGGAPKFPQPALLDFLLTARRHLDNEPAQQAVDHAIRFTLDRIAAGGIHDHVGGGFHRYAVDASWTVPHFEKMLYDNAQLGLVYARAARVFDDAWYRRIVRTTLDYLLRVMTNASAPGQGGFFSAQDAEVNHREGLNYLWTPEQFAEVLGTDSDWACRVYGLTAGPNFRDPHHPDEPARSVLRLADRPERLAEREHVPVDAWLARLDRVNAALRAARDQRPQPHTDDKILAAWNGLAIEALVEGSSLLDEPRYARAARAAAAFVLEEMCDQRGGLMRTSRIGQTHTPAFLEDYGAVIGALCALHRAGLGDASFEPLAAARRLADLARAAFADPDGRYYDTRKTDRTLFVRARSTYDGAMPSGSSLMLHALISLHECTGQADYADEAGRLLAGISADLARSPVAAVHATAAVLRMMASPRQGLRRQIDDAAAESFARVSAGTPRDLPVLVFADTDRVQVRPDEPAVVHLELRIREGYHVVAADPGQGGQGLFPLRVGLVEGSGVAVYADYPPGSPLEEDDSVRIYTGTVTFAVAIEHAPGVGAGPGRPVLGITFQACTDTECLQPQTIAIGIDIDTPGD